MIHTSHYTIQHQFHSSIMHIQDAYIKSITSKSDLVSIKMQVRNSTKPAISVHPITAFSTYKSTKLNILQILTCNLGPDRYTPSVPLITRRSCASQQLCKSTVRKLGPSFSSAQTFSSVLQSKCSMLLSYRGKMCVTYSRNGFSSQICINNYNSF